MSPLEVYFWENAWKIPRMSVQEETIIKMTRHWRNSRALENYFVNIRFLHGQILSNGLIKGLRVFDKPDNKFFVHFWNLNLKKNILSKSSPVLIRTKITVKLIF